MSGPCLTDAAPETAPGGLFVGRKPLCGGPNVNLSGRCGNLRRWCHLHLSIRTCHDVRSSASWPTKISVSLTTKRVNRIVTPHAALFCTVLAAGAPDRSRGVGATAKHVPEELVEQNYNRKRSFWTFFQCRECTSRRRLMDRRKRRTDPFSAIVNY
jgi:hypothetical protein